MPKYLLRCPNGDDIVVEPSQAGLEVECPGGGTVTVPTLREMNKLPRAEARPAANAATASQAGWGPRQGIIFLASLVAVFCLVAGLWTLINHPQPPTAADLHNEFPNLSPAERWEQAQVLQFGPEYPEGASFNQYVDLHIKEYEEARVRNRRWTIIWFGLAGVGAVVAGLAVAFKPQRAPSRRPVARVPG